MRLRRVAVAIAVALLCAGCATAPGDTGGGAPASAGAAGPAAAVPAEPTEGRRWLERGIALFEQGRFAESLRLLQDSPEIVADGVEAFAQCVTGRRAACRRSFDALLALDPSFALAPAEAGHPSWGPEFARARAASETAAGTRRAAR
jgi:hypothetical protein